MAELPLVYLEWIDAYSDSSWRKPENLDKWITDKDSIICQVGWIYKDTPEVTVLVASKTTNTDGQTQYGDIIKIPKAWIHKRVTLSLPKPNPTVTSRANKDAGGR